MIESLVCGVYLKVLSISVWGRREEGVILVAFLGHFQSRGSTIRESKKTLAVLKNILVELESEFSRLEKSLSRNRKLFFGSEKFNLICQVIFRILKISPARSQNQISKAENAAHGCFKA